MKAARLTLALVATGLAGCSTSSGLTTGSLIGSDAKSTQHQQGPANDPMSRAFQVGTVSARAIKCGFNFDPAKLKTNYLAYERLQPSADLAKIERTYDVSFNGIAKAVAGEKDYCTDEKTASIKADLSRHLAGDYTPSALPKKQEDDGGIFSGMNWGSGDSPEYKQHIPMDNSNI